MNEQGSASVHVQDGNRPLSWLLFSFEGRIPRSTWWGASIALSVIGVALEFAVASGARGGAENGSPGLTLVLLLWLLVSFWMGIALNAKRWHDRGKTGWMTLVLLIPFLGWLWALVELGFLKGTSGSNAYGPDPLGSRAA